jgi:hypothetical protein
MSHENLEFVLNINGYQIAWEVPIGSHDPVTASSAFKGIVDVIGIEGLENFLSFAKEFRENLVIGISAWYGVSHSIHFNYSDEEIASNKKARNIDIFIEQLADCIDGFIDVQFDVDDLEVN